jgi:prepilin-type N-terminal cleavage/methylation domain-containing protein
MTSSQNLRTFAASGAHRAFRHHMVMALLNRRGTLHAAAQGFTLVELVIVLAIVLAILLALALPRYRDARNSAMIGARSREAVSFAKDCAFINV